MALSRISSEEAPMDNATSKFVRAGTLEELKAEGRLVVHGRHRPVLLVYEDGHVFALDNRCPHMGSLWSAAVSRTAS
jgi:nitrite reductase/ring-hydroxylating ferredoxin subunit